MDDSSRTLEKSSLTVEESTLARLEVLHAKLLSIQQWIREDSLLLESETDPEERTRLRNSVASFESALGSTQAEIDLLENRRSSQETALAQTALPFEQPVTPEE
jgi:hypothetical protein